MFRKAHDFNIDRNTQINTKNYQHVEISGASSNSAPGRPQRNTRIKAQNYYAVNVVQEPEPQSQGEESPTDFLLGLSKHVSPGALNNSSERFDAPKCHEHTRVAVQEEIFSWITDGEGDAEPKKMLWITGPAGTGKTAIAGSVADACQQAGYLAASFFFSTFARSPDRRTKGRLVTTLAYQLCQHRVFRDCLPRLVGAAIRKDPIIFQKNLHEQVEALILRPLRECQGLYDPSQCPKVIVIDGLDECDGDRFQSGDGTNQQVLLQDKALAQNEILSILLRAANDPTFPFLIIVASRPEHHIRRFFSAPTGKDASFELFLDDKYDPDTDITLFYKAKFAQIRRRFSHLPASWPGSYALRTLVSNASGQFVYAATVVRFIETPTAPPQVQLECVLNLRAADGSPFGTLDALYTRILTSSPNSRMTIRWLKTYRWLDVMDPHKTFSTAWFFNRLFESAAGEADILVGSLPSLMRIPSQDDKVKDYTFYHKSLFDFLDDPNRSSAFPIEGVDVSETWLKQRIIRTLSCKGPQVPLALENDGRFFDSKFFECLAVLWAKNISVFLNLSHDDKEMLLSSDVEWWGREAFAERNFSGLPGHLFLLVHEQCRGYSSCRPVCKHWRKRLLKTWAEEGKLVKPTAFALLRDRFRVEDLSDPYFLVDMRPSRTR